MITSLDIRESRFLKLVLCFLVVNSLSVAMLVAQSSFSRDYNIVYAYYLDDPLTTVHLAWIEGHSDSQNLEIRRQGTTSWNRPQVNRQSRIPGSEKTLHEVQLTNLRAGSVYEFRFGSSGVLQSFRTLPETHDIPVGFVSGGDLYGSVSLMTATTSAAAASNPYFAVIGGDWAYADGDPARVDRWFNLLDIWHRNAITTDGHIIPFVPVIGNHEVQGGYRTDPEKAPLYFTFFDKPDKRAYYTLDVGDYLSLILLDSNHTNSVAGKQTEWLSERLQERAHVEHLFPSYHVAAWPSFRSFTNPNSRDIRNHWVPLFEQAGIRLAFEHHDHTFKRTKPILNGEENENGVVYIGDGAWGVGTRDIDESDRRWYLEKASSDHHFWHIVIAPGMRIVRALDPQRNLLDSFTQYTAEAQRIIEIPDPEQPVRLALEQNYPNPFNSSTQIRFMVPPSERPSNVTLEVFNIRGQRVAGLVNETLTSGPHTITFNAGNAGLSTGVYLYRLQHNNVTEVRKMQLVK
ncbi:MAG: T9SS type A sorting domain-containing protein [Balneolia bacterium]|nr:T9SS type A sorting domain-containing protein [Balneolia bacterium]